MEHTRSGSDVFLRLDPGDELHASIQAVCRSEGISGAAVTSGIGRVRNTDIGYLGDDGIYHRIVLEEAAELLSMQGNVALLEGVPFTHLHIVLSDNQHDVHGGHLFSATVHVTGEIHLRILEKGVQVPMSRCSIPGSEFKPLSFER
jgi:predicted DNA-binding protein with PD1-like motif